jgi:hypothetical protein
VGSKVELHPTENDFFVLEVLWRIGRTAPAAVKHRLFIVQDQLYVLIEIPVEPDGEGPGRFRGRRGIREGVVTAGEGVFVEAELAIACLYRAFSSNAP